MSDLISELIAEIEINVIAIVDFDSKKSKMQFNNMNEEKHLLQWQFILYAHFVSHGQKRIKIKTNYKKKKRKEEMGPATTTTNNK